MSLSISIDQLSDTISEILTEYTEEKAAEVKKVVDEMAEEVDKEIKAHCTFGGSGIYIEHFDTQTTKENKLNKEKVWYVKGRYARLTHLLEKGHATVNGGRTRAYPHIKYGNALVKKEFPKKIKKVFEK